VRREDEHARAPRDDERSRPRARAVRGGPQADCGDEEDAEEGSAAQAGGGQKAAFGCDASECTLAARGRQAAPPGGPAGNSYRDTI